MNFSPASTDGTVTTDDVARWCEELGALIRDGAEPAEWVARCEWILRKLRAAKFLIDAQRADQIKATTPVAHGNETSKPER